MGIQYHITEMPTGGIAIRTQDKQIIVKYPFEKINQAWYDWVMLGHMVQEAFKFMTPDEREFIMTGITADEWVELFKGREE